MQPEILSVPLWHCVKKINMEFVEMALPVVSVKYSQKGNARHDAAGSQSPTRKGQS